MSRATVKFNSDTSRAARFLGIDYDHVVGSIFPTSKDANVTGGKLLRGDFLWFWGQMSSGNASQASSYLLTLLEQLRSTIEAKTPVVHNVPIDGIINTIAMLVLYNQVQLDTEPIKSFLTAWQASSSDASRENQIINNILRLVNLRSINDLDVVLTSLVIGASTLLTHKELSNSSTKQATYDESDIQSNEMVFMYTYLLNTINVLGSSCQLNVLNTILNKTLTLTQQMKVNQYLAQTTLLGLLHVTTQILRVDSVNNVAFLKRAINIIQPYYFWPAPYCNAARMIMEKYQSELILPGWNRRECLFSECNVVDYQCRTVDQRSGYTYTKPIFYLYDTEDIASVSTLAIFEPTDFTAANIVNISSDEPAPPNMIMLAIFHCINTDVPCTDEEFALCKHLSPSDITDIYSGFMDLEQAIFKSPSKFNRVTELTNLKNKIMDRIRVNQGKNYVNTAFILPISTENSNKFCPNLPPVEHVRIPLVLRSKINEHDKPDPTYPAATVFHKLHQVVKGYYNPNVKVTTPREIRFVIAGNDVLTQHITIAYYALTKMHPEFFTLLSLKFYLAPVNRNGLGGYIARHDSWYNRHIYSPLRANCFVVPWKKDDDGDMKTATTTGNILPSAFFRECIEQYTKEASYTLNTVIYQIECYVELPTKADAPPDETIPFVQRVEFGLPVAIEEYRIRTRKPSNTKPDEILREKGFSYQYHDFTVKFTRQDLSGLNHVEITDETAPYVSLLLSNVPRKTDQCFPSDPTSENLEVFAAPYKADKSKYKKNILTVEPRQHVSKLHVSSPTQKFHILADGMLYGPYAAIQVAAAMDMSGKIARFPIQTYFPIDG